MELFYVSVAGYRRFKTRTALRTNGKLLAILGPNEAGKSSLLQAIRHLSHDEAIPALDVSRGTNSADLAISGKFLLNNSEIEEANLGSPRWLVVTKSASGSRSYTIDPLPPEKDFSYRSTLADVMLPLLEIDQQIEISQIDVGEIAEDFKALAESGMTAPRDLIQRLDIALAEVTKVVGREPKPRFAAALAEWKLLKQREAAPTPLAHALKKLIPKLPDILFFDDDARDLSSSYAISALREDVPLALDNLLSVAELDLEKLFSSIDQGDNAAVTTIENAANRLLQRKFREAWKQSGVHTSLRISAELLEIQIVNDGVEFTSLDERSDGLRQFVALQAFATCNWTNSPILLIDEAEHHLHYDAQADLVQMLSRQQVSPKVIYTTHSAGCLPEDLGNGVRLTRFRPTDRLASEIINKFWAAPGPGLDPLLIGMGASTLAFFPTRRAVMVEGPADMLLYPPMFREALEVRDFGFQFVPGLSTTGPSVAPKFRDDATGVFYLVDGDPGGTILRAKLREAGVRDENIVVLRNANGSAVEPEDFLDPALLLWAANRLISRHHPSAGLIRKSELKPKNRGACLEGAYLEATGVKFPKIEFAYEVLGVLDSQPDARLLDPRRLNAFRKVAAQVIERVASSRVERVAA